MKAMRRLGALAQDGSELTLTEVKEFMSNLWMPTTLNYILEMLTSFSSSTMVIEYNFVQVI